MAIAKVFKSGNSQAVRLPKEFRFTGPEVEIYRRGDEIVLREKAVQSEPTKQYKGLERAYDLLRQLPIDESIKDMRPPEKREDL